MKDKIGAAYIGSCRYEGLFTDPFPPRVYCPQEAVFILKNLEILSNACRLGLHKFTLVEELLGLVMGQSMHEILIARTLNFLSDYTSFLSQKRLVIEVGSLHYCRYGNTIVSDFFLNRHAWNGRESFSPDKFISVKMGVNELAGSIASIQLLYDRWRLCRPTVYLIPNIDLCLARNQPERSPKRRDISETLYKVTQLINSKDVVYVDLWEQLRSNDIYLNEVVNCIENDRNHFNQRGYELARQKIAMTLTND